jgi:DNA-binding MarR family transcriptional regulator
VIRSTSLKVYREEVEPTLSARQEAVLSAFRRRERLTNLELARFLEWEINTVTPRVKELRDKGILEEHCKRTCNISGRTAICWQIKIIGQLTL